MASYTADKWNDRTSSTRFRFMRVSRKTGFETEQLSMLKGGSITRNNDVRAMETAEVGCIGDIDLGPDFVRIYMDAQWPDGASTSIALGTFLASTPTRAIKRGYQTATVKMTGRLQELLDDSFARPVTLTKGANAVAEAKKVCEDMGMTVISDPSDFTITRTRVYGIGQEQNNSEVGSTKLDMVNDLLSLAGFWAAKTDPMGRVLFKRYQELSDRAPTWTFEEGPRCKFDQSWDGEEDNSEIANHVVCVFSSDSQTVIGEAWDRDPDSIWSTESIGRSITKAYTFTEIPKAENGLSVQQMADKKAAQYLKQNQSVIERYTFRHAYCPATVTDAVNIRYGSAGVSGKFEVRVQQMSLTAGCPTQCEARRFNRGMAFDRSNGGEQRNRGSYRWKML